MKELFSLKTKFRAEIHGKGVNLIKIKTSLRRVWAILCKVLKGQSLWRIVWVRKKEKNRTEELKSFSRSSRWRFAIIKFEGKASRV